MKGLLLIIVVVLGLIGKVASVALAIALIRRCVKSTICSNWTLRNVDYIICNF